jgi:hypothetical protein
MADGYSHGSPWPVDPDAEAERLAAQRELPDWQPIPARPGFSGSCEQVERCARCGALVCHEDTRLHDSWHAGQPSLTERVRTLATRDRTRG